MLRTRSSGLVLGTTHLAGKSERRADGPYSALSASSPALGTWFPALGLGSKGLSSGPEYRWRLR